MKKHVFWLIELFIWLFIIVFIIFSIRFYNAKKAAKESTYHIFLQDIDGLMKGSPIKLMGVQVGYVTEINIIDDYMYVSFLISKEKVTV
ncbi:MCE family protein, partial [bacterium]|nr:MCE family protein [bacterium]